MPVAWRPMTADDLDAVVRIADVLHPAYPESPDVVADRLRLFPEGCRIAARGDDVLGYAVAHPWRIGPPPALDTVLGRLPDGPDCLYMHDVALLPPARGRGLPGALVGEYRRLAASLGLGHVAMVAVNGLAPYWKRFGFRDHPTDAAVAAKLASYGSGAAYLVG